MIVYPGPVDDAREVIQFLRKDPDTPPPFFLAMFAFYWAILAAVVHFFLNNIKHHKRAD